MQVLSPHLAQRIIIIAAVGRAPFGRRRSFSSLNRIEISAYI
jgi:hypothetical protein